MKTHAERTQLAHALGAQLLLTIEFIERVQDFPSGPQLREIISSEMHRGRLAGLRILERDVKEMTSTLAPNERDGLEALLKQRLGYDADAAWHAERAAMRVALVAGRIRSEKERVRLERYLEALIVRGDGKDEAAAIEALLRGS